MRLTLASLSLGNAILGIIFNEIKFIIIAIGLFGFCYFLSIAYFLKYIQDNKGVENG